MYDKVKNSMFSYIKLSMQGLQRARSLVPKQISIDFNELMFYNWRRRDCAVEEKNKLIELVASLENQKLIKYILSFVEVCIKKWGK